MSEKWHGGKGDSTRVGNWDTYRENYNKIFRKKETQTPMETQLEEIEEKSNNLNLAFWGYTTLAFALIVCICYIIGGCI